MSDERMVANVGTTVNLKTLQFLDKLADAPGVTGMRGAVRIVLMAGIEHIQQCKDGEAADAAPTAEAE